MKINTLLQKLMLRTHEGAPAVAIPPELQLRRSVLACMLWEDMFYEDGMAIADRIAGLVAQVDPEYAAAVAVEARSAMKLRHAPLWIVRAMARLPLHKAQVAGTLESVIQRPDELTEFLALYWKDGRVPVSAQVKRGLGRALRKFGEYQLAKYDRPGAVRLRDVLFITHPRPQNDEQQALWNRLAKGELATPDTWEVALSGGADKRETWERMIGERKLGALALLRNLRNMTQAGVPEKAIRAALREMKIERVLPFRFITAARHAPQFEPELEAAMLKCLGAHARLPGKTAIVVDNSGSMHGAKVSRRSELDRFDAAAALAILVREVCEECVVIGFGTEAAVIPARRGFALRDAIKAGPGGGTYTQTALDLAAREGYDRLILITDEQSHQAVKAEGELNYGINIGTYQNGITYGANWTHLDGWSEAILDYIIQAERTAEA
jgi:60 kDa SS-A/Ro ribonucleoprotein